MFGRSGQSRTDYLPLMRGMLLPVKLQTFKMVAELRIELKKSQLMRLDWDANTHTALNGAEGRIRTYVILVRSQMPIL